MDRTKSGSHFQNQNRVVCESCKALFVENDQIIENLRKDLANQEEKVWKLQEEAVKETENLDHVLGEKALLEDSVKLLKMQLENLQSIQVHEDESSKIGKAPQALKILQDQLQGLEEEKKRLNKTIRRFESDTEELTDMFAMQGEKFELEVANKDRVISVLEKERELMEKDSKYNRNELEKTRSTNESIKKQVEQLKSSIQQKDAAIVNLSDNHNAVLKQTKDLQKELILSEESLKSELSNREIIEKRLTNERKKKDLLAEEIQQLKMQLKRRDENDIEFRAAKIQLLTEVERLKELVENLEMEKNENEKDISEAVTFSEKLRREKENTENVLEEMERQAAELKMDFDNLRNENFQMEKNKKSLETMVENMQTEMKFLSETRTKIEKEMSNLQNSLDETETSLETKMIENNTLEENVQTLNKALDGLKKNKEQQKKCIQRTKDELDTVISDKQSLELDYKKLKDNSSLLKEKVNTFSKEIESLQLACDTKTKQNENLEDVVEQKTRIIASLQEQEQKLENDIEELLGNEASSGIELKNVKNECAKLKQENKTIGKVYENVNLQLQECLDLLHDRREEYITEKKRLEEELEKLAEETSRFRKQNAELSKDLRNQSDEIISLTMDKEEFLQMFEDRKNKLEAPATVQNRLEEEVHLLKQRLEKSEKNERLAMKKQDEVKRKHEDAKQKLETNDKEKEEVEDSLAVALDDVDRWKKVSREIKEERDRLQMQIEELDRDLNEKHLHFTEEKSSLEKDMESLGNVIKRLKSNEERLRSKIDHLRDEVDKLSDIKSEQLTQIRTLVHEKNQMANAIADYENIEKEHTLLKKNTEEARRENADLRKEVDGLQEKARKAEEENERLRKELQERSSLLNGTQVQVKDTNQQYKELRNECAVLSDCNAEIQEEKQRLFNENSRLKEKKNNMIQERNRLQDMIESLDKCHSEKYEHLSRKNALLEKELTSLRHTIKNREEKERRLLNEKKESNEKLQKVISENAGFQGALNKSDVENKRLKKRIGELVKEIEQSELECEAKMCMKINLEENEECIKKLKQNAKVMNTLIISLNQQQNQRKDEINNKEREINELKANIETKHDANAKFKEVIRRLNKELEAATTRERCYVEELQDEKDKNGQSASLILRMEKEIVDCKELYERNCDKHKKKVQDMSEEISKILETMQKLKDDNVQINLCNDGLNSQIQARQDDICLMKADRNELERKSKKIDEEKVELSNEINTLQNENHSFRKHAENLEKVIASTNSAMSDQTTGMENEIQVLRDSLAQHRSLEEANSREIEELKEKLQKEKNEKIVDEIKINEMRLKQERLEGKNEELLSNCARLEENVNKGVELKLEKESKERLLTVAKKRTEVLENELEEKIQQVSEQNFKHENLHGEILKYIESLKKLTNAKEELVASNKKLIERNEHVLQEFNLINENYKQMSSEKLRLLELVTFQEKEIESLKREVYNAKSELQSMNQEAESDKSQLQDALNKTEETLARITDKQQRLQDELRKVKEETEDLENENEDLLAELDQSKEQFTRVKDTLCALQIDYGNLQEELRANLNSCSEKTDKHNLKTFEMETEITSLKERLTNAHERTEKQRELEKILREEIEELSDAYVKLEEEIHHGNKENLVLKEKLQELSQNAEELELARETANLLKEKRHSELLKSEKNVQCLEKNLREKQNSNKKLWKELNAITEKQKFHELKFDSEKDISEQRLKQLQDLQNSQRNLDEQLWLSKRNQEKFEAEIETWKLNSNSMKIRIEMLEEELKYTTSGNEKMALLCTQTKNEQCLSEEEAQKKEMKLCQQIDFLEERVRETSEKKDRLEEDSKCLGKKLNQQNSKITDLNTLLEEVNNKYECLRMLVSALHNDVTRKDEQIEKLEERKKQMINSLADLDSKIAEIQVQAISLENENNNFRKELAQAVSTEKCWKETVEQQAKLFSENFERETREKQQLHNTKEYLQQAHMDTEIQLQETSIEVMQLRIEKEQVIAENTSLLEAKNSVVNDVKEKDLTVEKLTQMLNVEKHKTATLKEEITCLLVECQTLKTENSHIIEQQVKTNCDLKETNTKIKETEDRLEDTIVNLEKMEENLSIAQKELKEQVETIAYMSVKHNEMLQSKDELIDSVTEQTQHLEKMVDTLTSNLHQCEADNTRNETEKKCVQEIVTRKEQLLENLQTSHQNVVKMKESLESEKKCLSSKLKLISKELAKLEFDHERSLSENEKLYSENVNQKRDSMERYDMLLKEKQMLEEELQVQKTKLENVDIQNNNLRVKNKVESNKLEETVDSLKDIQQKLHTKHQEIERLSRTLQNSNLERENLNDVNQRMGNALLNLKNETGFGPKQDNLETRESLQDIHETSDGASTDALQDRTVEFQFSKSNKKAIPGNSFSQFQKVNPSHGVLPRESSELETSVSLIESEVHFLRNGITERDTEISRFKVLLDLLQNEKESLDIELARHVKRCENECKQKENINEDFLKTKYKFEDFRKEKEETIRKLKEKNLDIAKRSAAMEEEIDFLKSTKLRTENQREEFEKKMGNLQDEFVAKEKELRCARETIVSCKEEIVCFEKKISDIEDRNEKMEELIGKYEEEREEHLNQIEKFQKLSMVNLNQLEKLENGFHLEDCQTNGVNSSNTKDYLKEDEKENIIHQELSELTSLVNRFDKLHEKNAFQFKKMEKLQVELTNGQNQWMASMKKLNECKTEKGVLEKEYFDLEKKFTTTETKYKEVQGRVNKLETKLEMTEETLAVSTTVREEEKRKISQELTQMQIELVSACEKFNKSISNAKSLEEKLQGKDKHIIDLENSLKRSRENEGKFEIRNAELKTKTEILAQTNGELNKAKEGLVKGNKTLENILRNEREENNKQGVLQQVTIGQLKLKLEDAEWRVIKMTEELAKAEDNLNQIQDELNTTTCQFRINDLRKNSEIQESNNTILQLNRSVSQLKEDVRQLEKNKDDFTTTNESLKEKISSVEKELQRCKNISNEASQEKDVLQKSLEETFIMVFNENEANCHDLNDQISKINKVAKVVKQLRKKEGMLEDDCKHLQKQLSILQDDKKMLHYSFKAKDEDFEQLSENNTKLKKYVQKLEVELDRVEARSSHIENQLHGLKENLETMKSNEIQQQYQYKVLENEKESLENEALLTHDKVETLFEKIRDSFNLFSPDAKGGIHDDSGVYADESTLNKTSERRPSDSGIFSPGCKKLIKFPEDEKEETFPLEHNGSLQESVEKSVQIMTFLEKTFHEKTQLFLEKEENLANEIGVLKQTVNHKNDIRSVLENDVQRLDRTQNNLQEQLEKKHDELTSSHVELRHLETVLREKEKVVEMLNESIQGYQKRQEFLENKLKVIQKEAEQEKNQRLDLEKGNMDCEKKCEELRQNMVRNDVGCQKKMINLDTKIRELENKVTEAENVNAELRSVNATLNSEQKKSGMRITGLESHLNEVEKENKEFGAKIADLSKELENSIATNGQLENTYKEIKESYNEAIKQQQIVNAERENDANEVKQAKEETNRLLLESNSLADELKLLKQSLKEKECENVLLVTDVAKKEKMVKDKETKLKAIADFLEQINKCKDQLENEINQAKKSNEELKISNKLSKKEKTSMLEEIKTKELEIETKEETINQLQNKNVELEKVLRSNRHAVKEGNDVLEKSLSHSEKIKNIVDATEHLLKYPSCTNHKKRLDNPFDISAKIRESDDGKKVKDLRSVPQQLSEIYITMETVFQKCQKNMEDQRDLLNQVFQLNQLLKKTEQENAKLHTQEKQLHHKVITLSEERSNLESLSEMQQEDLVDAGDKLFLEKTAAKEHENLNSALTEQVNQLQAAVISYAKLAGNLRKDRSALKIELMETQTELDSLKSTKIEEKQVLDETQKALILERERITTVTKVARLKENDLGNAKMSLKEKEDSIGQLQKQVIEINEEKGTVVKELAKELITVRKNNEVLTNENVFLQKKCSTLEQQREESQNSYNQTRNQFIQTKSRKDQLEKIIFKRDEKLKEIQNQRVALQVEVKTQEKSIEDLNNEVDYLIDQTNALKKSEELMQIENSQLGSNIKETKDNLEEAKDKLAQKERDESIAQIDISSGKEFIKMLREEAAKSEKQLEGLRNSVAEKEKILEKVNKDLEFQRSTTTQLRDDKSNLDELYRLCQRSEREVQKDLEDCKLVIDKIQTRCRQLEDKETQQEKSFCELQRERNVLDSKVNEVEKSIFHQQKKNKEISKEISRLTQEKYSLVEKMRAVERSLGDTLKENAVLILKQEQMNALKEETLVLHTKLEELYKTVRKEKTNLEKQTSAYEKQVVILQRELDASLEINEHLETKHADENKSNNALRLKVEEQSHRVVTLDNLLKTTVIQVEEKNNKIASLKEEFHHATYTTKKRNEEILQVREEWKNSEDLLQETRSQLQNFKKLNEDTVYSKKEMEAKLHEITMILESSENLLSQEKNKNANLKLEIKANEKKLKEKTGNLLSQLSAAKIREDTVKQELESTKTLLGDIKTELNAQRKKTKATQENRKSTVEELSTLKVNYICAKAKLEQRQKENKKLQDEKNSQKAQMDEMDEKMQSRVQEGLKKADLQKQEIDNLRTELSAWEMANQSLGKDLQEVQEKCDILRKQKYQNQQEFNSALEEEEKLLKELELSCSKKEEVNEEVTRKLITEKRASEKLQQNLVSVTANLGEVKSNLEILQQKHKDIAQELILLRQTVKENWKLNEGLESSDKNLDVENKHLHDKLDPSNTIRSLCISLKSLKSFTDELEWNSSNLTEQLAKSDEDNQKAAIAQIQLKEEVKFLKMEVRNFQNDSKSLRESLEESHRSLQKKNVENKTMRAEVIELKEKKTGMEDTIDQLQDAYLALNTEMGVIERKRVSLEDTLRGLESERDKTVKELSTELTTLGTQKEASVNENKDLQERLAEAQKEISDLEKTKQDLLDEKAAGQRKLKNLEREKIVVEVELKDVKRMYEKLTDELNKLNILNSQTMERNAEFKRKRTQLKEENVELERNVELFQQRIDRLENDHSDKDMAKPRLQNQLDEAFNSLERQQAKLSQVLSDKETLRNELLKAEKELNVVMEDNVDLNQQLYSTHKNIFSSPNSDELSRFRNRLSELRRKELALTQENRFLLEKLREKSNELRDSKLREEQSRSEMEKSRNKTKRYFDERDQWDEEVKSVISQIGSQNKPSSDSKNAKNFFSAKVNNARRKIL